MLTGRRLFAWCISIYLIAQVLLLIRIDIPSYEVYDEHYYVGAAREILKSGQQLNPEHPPLAKELIAVGMRVAGDQPLGWRLMSTVAGSLSLVAVFIMALAIFSGSIAPAIFCTLLTGFNFVFYVQSRIAMLDTFMFAFLAWSWAMFFMSWNDAMPTRIIRRHWTLSAVFLGFAIGCKWTAIVSMGLCLAIPLPFFMSRWMGSRVFQSWYPLELWRKAGIGFYYAVFLGLPVLAYILSLVPLLKLEGFKYSFLQLLTSYQIETWRLLTQNFGGHHYASDLTQWFLMTRPIWYAFREVPDKFEVAQGIVYLGNPLVMWSGIAATLACLWAWIAKRSSAAFLISIFYFAFSLCWLAVPRSVFFYYYYYPAAVLLSFAITFVFYRMQNLDLFFTLLSLLALMRILLPADAEVGASTYLWMVWGAGWLSVIAHFLSKGKISNFRAAKYIFLGTSGILFGFYFPILSALEINSRLPPVWMWLPSWI